MRVYFTKRDGSRKPPRDVDYFERLRRLADKYGAERIYRDYVRVYDRTGKQVKKAVLAQISQIAAPYGDDALEVDIVFSILYLAMIAEEQKEFTRLGKRIKRLGVHQLLVEDCGVDEAANFMRGMSWHEIAALCREQGF